MLLLAFLILREIFDSLASGTNVWMHKSASIQTGTSPPKFGRIWQYFKRFEGLEVRDAGAKGLGLFTSRRRAAGEVRDP